MSAGVRHVRQRYDMICIDCHRSGVFRGVRPEQASFSCVRYGIPRLLADMHTLSTPILCNNAMNLCQFRCESCEFWTLSIWNTAISGLSPLVWCVLR